MERGYLNMISRQVDPVHYLKIDGSYHTLSFSDSYKVSHVRDNQSIHIEFSYDPTTENYMGPFDVKRDILPAIELKTKLEEDSVIKYEAEVIEDLETIKWFQDLSELNDFNYFPADYIDEIVLIRYS